MSRVKTVYTHGRDYELILCIQVWRPRHYSVRNHCAREPCGSVNFATSCPGNFSMLHSTGRDQWAGKHLFQVNIPWTTVHGYMYICNPSLISLSGKHTAGRLYTGVSNGSLVTLSGKRITGRLYTGVSNGSLVTLSGKRITGRLTTGLSSRPPRYGKNVVAHVEVQTTAAREEDGSCR